VKYSICRARSKERIVIGQDIDYWDYLHTDASDALDENLLDDEPVRVIIRGTDNSAIIGTDRRVFVFKRGAFSGVRLGKKLASWDYGNVTGVQLEIGKLSGVALIQAPGVPAVDVSYWATGPNSARKSPNAIPIVSNQFEEARSGTAELRRLIAEYQSARNAPQATTPDIMQQLRQLGDLHNAGILTKEEFDAKKAELLARL
jgi:hypothetical protein